MKPPFVSEPFPSAEQDRLRREALRNEALRNEVLCNEALCNEAMRREAVVLVHGMLAGPRSMKPLESLLIMHGFEVVNWNYATLRHSIAVHAERLRTRLQALDRKSNVRWIHFVTHSMGGLVVRAALQQRLPKARRLVMLAPPNAGSRLTRIPLGPLQWCFPPLVELHESPNSFVNRLPPPANLEVGVLAAADDRVVCVGSTHLNGQADHRVVAGGHNALPRRADTGQYVLRFLQSGRFESQLRRAA